MSRNPRKEEMALNDSAQHAAIPDSSRVYLVVPYKEKDEAKSLGAKWDKSAKSWYIQGNHQNRQKIEKWLPKNAVNHVSIHTPQQQFTQFLTSMGAIVGGQEIIMDGKKRRIRVAHDKGTEKSGVYLGFLDGIPAGYFKDFRSGTEKKWKVDQHDLSSEQIKSLMEQAEENRRLRRAAEELAQKESAEALKALLPFTLAASDTGHDYLTNKNVRAGGLRIIDEVVPEQLNPLIKIAQDEVQARDLRDQHPDSIILMRGDLLVPVQGIDGNLRGAQVIRKDGTKLFTKNTLKESNFHIVGTDKAGIDALKDLRAIVIAEGYATADTVSQAIQQPVVTAFDSGNLLSVAQVLKERFPEKAFVIAGDDDYHLIVDNKANVGREKALEAAQEVGGTAVFPIFLPNEQVRLHLTDFNDLANKSSLGIDAVKRQITPVVEVEQLKVATLNKAKEQKLHSGREVDVKQHSIRMS